MDAQPDPTAPPRRRLTPLTAALLIPALGLALVAGLWLGSHAKTQGQPTAVASPTPPPLPSATPWPGVWPPEDGGRSDAPVAYGVLAITPSAAAPLAYTATLDPAATLPPAPDPKAAVQRVRPLTQAIVDGVAHRLGSRVAPASEGGTLLWIDIGLRYDPITSTFRVTLDARDGALPATPFDTATAERAADLWLVQRGLVDPMAPLGAVQVSRGDLAAFPTWQVTAPHLSGQSQATQITMQVSGTGHAGSVVIVHPLVVAAAQYPTAGWQAAWAQVQAGRARDATFTGDAIPKQVHVDRITLTARIVLTAGGTYVIPAYAFTDSASGATLYWPALDPSTYTPG